MKTTIFLLLLVLSFNLQADGFKRYEFPPLEYEQEIETPNYPDNQSNDSQNKVNKGNKSSYFQQPRYTFPELEKTQKNSSNYSTYNFPEESPHPSSKPDYMKLPSSKTQTNNKQNSYGYDKYKQDKYDSGANRQDYYSQSYPARSNQYLRQGQYNPYGSYPMNSYSNRNNTFGYPIYNPFMTNSFFGNNNAWNPISNGFSSWPNFNNGMFGNPSQGYPNIRTPGFFSR